MRILITGGSGFIGTNLVEKLLDKGEEVLSIDVKPPKIDRHRQIYKMVDICDFTALVTTIKSFKPEYIVHLAARTDLDEKHNINAYAANIVGVENMIKAIKQCATVKRCIYTSTQLVCKVGYYPKSDDDYLPNTVYGKSKVMTERIVKSNNGGGVEWVIIRPTTIWGPWTSAHYQRFYRLIKKGYYFHLGFKERFKSYGYVGNTCCQILKILELPANKVNGQTFYVADYKPTSLNRWDEEIRRQFHASKIRAIPIILAWLLAKIGDLICLIGFREFPFTSFRMNNIMTEYVFDLSKTKSIVPELPYTMEEGVCETIKWLEGCNS
ncbi:MAG: NAD(P)-dependent oxidoreductase [Candidatus Saganbacteria bacterium]|nr:NAD(P)-dependent oxidoreductase [Candidatus Saganbacteria bacterium]